MAQEQESLNILPGWIRSNLDIITGPDIFYNMRRKAIEAKKAESLDDFVTELRSNGYSSVISKSDNGTLVRASVLNCNVSCHIYASDIMIIDDTAGTNIYDMKLEVIIVIDPESKSQLYGFGFLSGQDQDAYQTFFQEIKDISGQSPRVIIVDRSPAQYAAIRSVFPNTYIAFCLRHLGKDLQKYFPPESDIIIGFYDIQRNFNRCNEYMELLRKTLQSSSPEPTGHEIIRWMIENEENWLPINLIRHGVFDDWTTNRAEGFFGMFKQRFGFKRFTLRNLAKNLIIQGKTMIVDSLRSIKSTNEKYAGLDCVQIGDIERIGARALAIIAFEMVQFLAHSDSSQCRLCLLRQTCPELALPCRHVMDSCVFLCADALHPRYLRHFNEVTIESVQRVRLVDSDMLTTKYSDIMARFAPFASAAAHNPEIFSILKNALTQLEEVTVTPNDGMPSTISTQGKFSTHPARHVVLGGRPKEKHQYKCSICHMTGHNKATCPERRKEVDVNKI